LRRGVTDDGKESKAEELRPKVATGKETENLNYKNARGERTEPSKCGCFERGPRRSGRRKVRKRSADVIGRTEHRGVDNVKKKQSADLFWSPTTQNQKRS